MVRRTPADAVCLTFDACGGRRGSGVDRALLEVLATTGTPATLFLNARWIDANPSLARDLAAAPHLEIQDHGTRHRPLTVDGRAAYGIRGTRDVGELVDEVLDNRARLAALTGVEPTCFRAGTAHVDDVAVEICTRLGVRLVHFDVNADAGATFTPDEVRRALVGVRAGSIAIGHCNQPGSGTAAGVRRAIPELRDRGVRFARLSDALAG
ncbi:polysaccharide deacetylase family protein [uncultured Tessaracoccus sp.]|uniref:polysaccharide deacetylase family protein n=1 Tax=uncultured Tessaracoccus sp. TaxID=905023 RepID=UPI0025F56BEC|nr:polysaccharide deacetylase family protein [uncultured Tessaracoccus sp.]